MYYNFTIYWEYSDNIYGMVCEIFKVAVEILIYLAV